MYRPFILFVSVLSCGIAPFLVQPNDRNQIQGIVVNGASNQSSPVAGILVKALDSQGRLVASSIPGITNAAGKFILIVPAEVRLFNLIVYDPDEKYWVYQPNGEILNDRHPRDLGILYLDPRNVALTQDGVLKQFAAANVIKRFDSRSGNLLMAYLASDYTDQVPGQCSMAEVGAARQEPRFLQVALSNAQLQDATDLAEQIQTNEQNVRDAFKNIHSAELTYRKLHSSFTGLNDLAATKLIDSKIASGLSFGYCFVLSLSKEPVATAKVTGSHAVTTKHEAPSYSGYHLNAAPLTPGITGFHVFDSDESGKIRVTHVKSAE